MTLWTPANLISAVPVAEFDPGNSANLTNTSGAISLKNGYGTTTASNNSSNSPAVITVNGYTFLDYAGGKSLTLSSVSELPTGSAPRTFLTIAMSRSAGGTQPGLWGYGNGNGGSFYLTQQDGSDPSNGSPAFGTGGSGSNVYASATNTLVGNYRIMIGTITSTGVMSFRVDGAVTTATTSTGLGTNTNPGYIGYEPAYGDRFSGVIGAIFIASGVVNQDDLWRLESYYAFKCGMQAHIASDNPYASAPPTVSTTLNPYDADANLTFSNNNRTITLTHSGGWYNARSTTSKASGRFSFAVKYVTNNSSNNGIIFGIASKSSTLGNYPGSDANAVGFWDNGGQWLGGSGGSNLGTLVDGDWIVFDVNIDAKTIAASKNSGTWTTPRSFTFTGPYYAIGSLDNGNAVATTDFAGTVCPFSPPSGISWWDSQTSSGTITGTLSLTLANVGKTLSSNLILNSLVVKTLAPVTITSAAIHVARTATLSKTLGQATTTSSAQNVIRASSSKTLNATVTSTDKLVLNARSTVTLSSIQKIATGTVKVQATSSKTLAPATVVANTSAINKAVLNKTLANVTQVSASNIVIRASSTRTLNATVTSTDKLVLNARSTITLGTLTTSIVAKLPIQSKVSGTFSASVTSTVIAKVQATTQKTLSPATLVASSPPGQGAHAVYTLGNVSPSSTAKLSSHASSSKTLAPVTSVSAAKNAIRASVNKTLNATVTSTDKLIIQGNTSRILGPVSVIAADKLQIKSNLTKTLNSVSISSASKLAGKGTYANVLNPLSKSITAKVGNTARASIPLGPLANLESGKLFVTANVYKTLVGVSSNSHAIVRISASSSKTLQPVIFNVTGSKRISGFVTTTLDNVSVDGYAGGVAKTPASRRIQLLAGVSRVVATVAASTRLVVISALSRTTTT